MQALLGSWPEPPPPCRNVLCAVWDKQGAQVCSNIPLYLFSSQETRPNSWSVMRREEYSAGPRRGRRQEPAEALAQRPCDPAGSRTKQRSQTQHLGCKRNPQDLPSNRSPKRRPQAAGAPYPELWPWITQGCESIKQIHMCIGTRKQPAGDRGSPVPASTRNYTTHLSKGLLN